MAKGPGTILTAEDGEHLTSISSSHALISMSGETSSLEDREGTGGPRSTGGESETGKNSFSWTTIASRSRPGSPEPPFSAFQQPGKKKGEKR